MKIINTLTIITLTAEATNIRKMETSIRKSCAISMFMDKINTKVMCEKITVRQWNELREYVRG